MCGVECCTGGRSIEGSLGRPLASGGAVPDKGTLGSYSAPWIRPQYYVHDVCGNELLFFSMRSTIMIC